MRSLKYIGSSLFFKLETRHLVSYKIVVAVCKDWPCASTPAAAAKGSLGWTNGQRGCDFLSREGRAGGEVAERRVEISQLRSGWQRVRKDCSS